MHPLPRRDLGRALQPCHAPSGWGFKSPYSEMGQLLNLPHSLTRSAGAGLLPLSSPPRYCLLAMEGASLVMAQQPGEAGGSG